MSGCRSNSRGFTLVEALIATSMLALLAIMTLASTRTGFRMWDSANATNANIEEVAFAQGFLRRSIEGAYPRLKPDSAGAVDFAGTATSLEFSGPSVHAISLAGRARLEFSIAETDEGKNLVVQMRQEIAQETAAETKEILIRGAADIRFSYLPVGGDEWIEIWDERPGLPALVRLDVNFTKADRRRWPRLVIKPLIDADVDCRYDALTYGCRGRRR